MAKVWFRPSQVYDAYVVSLYASKSESSPFFSREYYFLEFHNSKIRDAEPGPEPRFQNFRFGIRYPVLEISIPGSNWYYFLFKIWSETMVIQIPRYFSAFFISSPSLLSLFLSSNLYFPYFLFTNDKRFCFLGILSAKTLHYLVWQEYVV